MFQKLRNKFLILNMAVTSLVMLTAFAVVYMVVYNSNSAEIERKLDNTGELTVTSSNTGNEPPNLTSGGTSHYTAQQISSDYSLSFVVTVDTDGNIADIDSLIGFSAEQYSEVVNIAWNQKKSTNINFADRHWKYRVSPFQITNIQNGQARTEFSGYYKITFLDITDMQKTMNDLLTAFLFVGIGMLAVIFVVSLFYANRSIKPIAESWEKQKKFIADASHELKTPLGTIMANYDVLISNEDETIKSQHEWLDYMKIGMDRMNRLISNLLILAKSENINIKVQKQSFDIDNLISSIIHTMNAAVQSKNLQINKKVEITGDIIGYEEQVGQVFTILYDNAIKYSNENGKIDIEVKHIKKSIVCSIKNTGQGISAKNLPYIFNRFYRSDTARSGEDNSYGLGLPIAKSITEQIGGKITVNSIENEWTSFAFSFNI